RTLGAQDRTAAGRRRGPRRVRPVEPADQRRRPLLRGRPRGAAHRRRIAQAHDRGGRRRRPRPHRAAARRRAHAVAGGGDRLRGAGPARLHPRGQRDRPRGAGRQPAMSSDDHANGSGAGQGAWAVYRRLLGHAWLYWPFLLAAMAAMIVEAAAGAAFVWLMEPLTNDGFVDPKPEMAVVLPATIIGLFLVRGLERIALAEGFLWGGRGVVRDVRDLVWGNYLRLPSNGLGTAAVPAMVRRINFDTEKVTDAYSVALDAILSDSLTLLFLF